MQKTKADIDFEQKLWKVANEPRGAVAENQYKDYELSLIFLKHLDDERIVSSPAKHKEYTNDKAVINIYACKANK